MFGVIMLFYISLLGWFDINTLCAVVDRKIFCVLRVDRWIQMSGRLPQPYAILLLLQSKYYRCFVFMTTDVPLNKTNRRIGFQFYWYHDSACFGHPFCPSSEVLSRTSALVHFMQFWWPFATSFVDRLLPGAGWNWMTGINRSSSANADVRLRTPDDGQKGCPKHVES